MKAKAFIFILLAVAVFPSAAAATNTPELTYPTGTKLAVESKLKGTNVGGITFTGGSATVSCTSAALTGTLKKNSGTEVEVSLNEFGLTGTGAGSRCTGSASETSVTVNGSCLRATPEMIDDEFQIRGASCSEGSGTLTVTFKKLAPVLECVYERSASITGTYTTHPGDAVLTANSSELTKVSGAFTCFSAFKLDSSFTFEKNEAGINPLYVSAGPTVTFPTGLKLGTGTKVRGRSVGEIKLTDLSGNLLLTCQAGETTGTLRKNSGTEIEVDIESSSYTGTGPESTCTSSFGNTTWTFNSATNGLPWCLKASSAMASDEFQLRGNNCAGVSRPIRVIAETNGLIPACVYQRKAAITGTYTTHPEDALLKFGNATLLESEPRKESCPDETQVDASFTLEKDEAGTKPVYIS
jgi:hypothetical protein